ncbi:Probable serine/threonine-protein kinase PBL26 [Linum perenne]
MSGFGSDVSESREDDKDVSERPAVRRFTFRELDTLTKRFRLTSVLGRGGFGTVYEGKFENTTVAVKTTGSISNPRYDALKENEFMTEVLMLSLLQHPNVIRMIGYCVDRDRRGLVYEYMRNGSLEKCLFDVKSGNILIDSTYNPRLADFGLSVVGHCDQSKLSTPGVDSRGTMGYVDPEYFINENLSFQSDTYGLGVVLLELLTGCRSLDSTRPDKEISLVQWVFDVCEGSSHQIADPLLEGKYPERGFSQVVKLSAMCFQRVPDERPSMSCIIELLTEVLLAETQPGAIEPSNELEPLKELAETQPRASEPSNELEPLKDSSF